MAKAATPSFVLELGLVMDPHEKKVLVKKLNIARQIYNACLGEALKRLNRLRRDPEYRSLLDSLKKASEAVSKAEKQTPSAMQKVALSDAKTEKKRISGEIRDLELCHGYSEYQLHAWSSACGKHFEGQIGMAEIQKLASRAFNAVEKVHYHKAEQVHFKKYGELISVENKSNRQGLRFKDGLVIWGELALKVRIRRNDVYAATALASRTKYIRIVPKTIRGKDRFYVQLVQEGYPPVKKNAVTGPKDETVGIDPGTSTMAVASESAVFLAELAPGTEADTKRLRRIMRAMDRSRRSTNPDNYEKDGTVKKGKKTWVYSGHYKRLAARRKECFRKLAAKRRQSHEQLANRVIALGLDVRVEDMNYKGLQKRAKNTVKNRKNGKIRTKKRFGRSLENRAPAMFLAILDRKLKPYGTGLKKADTRSLRASQYDHRSGTFRKKELKDRWNIIDDRKVQRDLYSAFLIANTNDTLDGVDREKAELWYEHFLKLHDEEVEHLKHSESRTLRWYAA